MRFQRAWAWVNPGAWGIRGLLVRQANEASSRGIRRARGHSSLDDCGRRLRLGLRRRVHGVIALWAGLLSLEGLVEVVAWVSRCRVVASFALALTRGREGAGANERVYRYINVENDAQEDVAIRKRLQVSYSSFELASLSKAARGETSLSPARGSEIDVRAPHLSAAWPNQRSLIL